MSNRGARSFFLALPWVITLIVLAAAAYALYPVISGGRENGFEAGERGWQVGSILGTALPIVVGVVVLAVVLKVAFGSIDTRGKSTPIPEADVSPSARPGERPPPQPGDRSPR